MDVENIRCGACGTVGECIPLGDMGSLKWFRCKACGMDVSVHKRTPTVRKGALKLGSRMRSIPLEEGERENPAKGIKFIRMPLEPGWPV